MPCVVKVNGERVDFSEEKLRTSFLRALHKRPVPTILIDEQVKNIIQHILISNLREIPSRQIGDYVMSSLSKLDQVAYVRYASIYRSFKDVSEFSDVIKEVQQQI
jgi:transcriptional repressor NrdR